MRAKEALDIYLNSRKNTQLFAKLSEVIETVSKNSMDCLILGDNWDGAFLTKEQRTDIVAWLEYNGYNYSDWEEDTRGKAKHSINIWWGNSVHSYLLERISTKGYNK